MNWKASCIRFLAIVSVLLGSGFALAQSGGTAVIRVVTIPAYADATVQFAGTPAGELQLDENGRATSSAKASSGQHLSRITQIDRELVDAGYSLADVSCDDASSARRSSGALRNSTATFEVEDGETVTCTFSLRLASACKCPKQGRWNVVNHPGSMICTGMMSMTMPLEASRSVGTLEPNARCDAVVAKGMSDEEADVTMSVQPDCSWKGAFGAEQDGMPTTINFHWNVENEEHIAGKLDSEYSQQGVTCRMARTFELDFEG